MLFGSVCSGIEAASVAFSPLGWRAAWLSEIEPFPSAVLAHHYPDVPNLGDMTRLPAAVLTGEAAAPDVLCGGTPCQAFSVAGMREGLNDPRGQLTIKFVELADAIDHVRTRAGKPECITLWENVPGVLSDRGNAFGCFLGALAGEDCELQPPGGKWKDAGCVYGPKRTIAWRVLDAQYFGLAQRRRRVFVVASARNDFDPCAVLFESDGLRRDTAPSREARQVAPTIPSRGTAGGGLGTDFDCDGGVIQAFGGNNQSGPIDVATARNACASASGRMDFETETFLVQPTHTLRGEGFDASEDVTGRGTPLVPIAFHPTQDPISSTDGTTHAMGCGSSGGQASVAVAIQDVRGTDKSQNGRGWNDDGTAYTLDTHATQGVAYTDSPMVFQPRHYSGRERMGGEPSEVCHTLSAQAGQGDSSPHVAHSMQVRRLTPVECERLMGFPDGYTAIPWRKNPPASAPMARATRRLEIPGQSQLLHG